ncbi:MAG: hypothetical protein HOA35_01370 [Euryarchaeota archaeon]|nr:hypothetical protein [Euryarchaeota archaeon]
MKEHKTLALAMISLFLFSGCLGAVEPGVEVPSIELPEDWSTTVQRTVSNPQLSQFSDCEELERALKISIEEEARTQILQAIEEQYFYGGMWMEDDMAMAESADGGTGTSSQPAQMRRVEGSDYSGTNNQEQGVDEADFVKTDGYNIYFINGRNLVIFAVPEFGELNLLSTTSIQGNPTAMMLDGDRLVVISSVSTWTIASNDPLSEELGWDDSNVWRTNSLTKFTVFDITNRSSPETAKELFIEGNYMTAREVNATVRTVTHAWMNIPGLQTWLDLPNGYWNLDYDDPLRLELREKVGYQTILDNQETLARLDLVDLLPKVYERVDGRLTVHTMDDDACADFVAPADSLNRGFNSIFTFDLNDENFAFQADHIVGNYPMVYASEDLLVLTENAWDWWWFWGNDNMNDATNIHTFDISNPGDTVYTGSGRVNGTILNQFSISEHEGVLRVAATSGQWARWWMENPEPMSSSVVNFVRSVDVDTDEQTLVEVGRVDNIAPEERIWSARFDGDRCYLVTFRQIDPLWVIDMSDETNPTILGELEIPGVSTYIHPLSRDHLLTIGIGPGEDGLGLDWSNTRLSLFNITDPTTPAVDDVLSLSPVIDPSESGWSWSFSEASYEHKAFQYWAPKGMLAVPLATYKYDSWYNEEGGYSYSYNFVSKLMIVNVSEETGTLSVHGEVNHSSFYSSDNQRSYYNSYDVRRSIFMGDFIYALSAQGVTATNLTTMETSASIALTYENVCYGCYDDVVVSDNGGEGSTSSESGEAESEPMSS